MEYETQEVASPSRTWKVLLALYLMIVVAQALFRFPFRLIGEVFYSFGVFAGAGSPERLSGLLYLLFCCAIYLFGSFDLMVLSRRAALSKSRFSELSTLSPVHLHLGTIVFYLAYYVIVVQLTDVDTMQIGQGQQQSLAIFCAGLLTSQWIVLPVMMRAGSRIKAN